MRRQPSRRNLSTGIRSRWDQAQSVGADDRRPGDAGMVRHDAVPGDLAAQLARLCSARPARPIPATAGPPRLMAATIGAKPTSTKLPPGIRTASDDPTRVSAIQKRIPSQSPFGAPGMRYPQDLETTNSADEHCSARQRHYRYETLPAGGSLPLLAQPRQSSRARARAAMGERYSERPVAGASAQRHE